MIQKQRTLRKTQTSKIHQLGPKKSVKKLKSPRSQNSIPQNEHQFYKNISLEHMIDNNQMGECLCLAYAENNGILRVNQSVLKIFIDYADQLISFVSVYGQKQSGKSFFCDRILNLAGFEGKHVNCDLKQFLPKSSNYKNNAIYMWSVPFKKQNECIFLLDVSGFQSGLSPQKIIINLIAILSSIVVILPSPEDSGADVHKKIYSLFKEAMNKIQIGNQPTKPEDEHWPQAVYCPLRSYEKIDKQQDFLNQIFREYKFLVIYDAAPNRLMSKKQLQLATLKDKIFDKRYLKGVAQLFKDVYQTILPKSYRGMQFNGRFVANMLKQLITYMNTYEHISISTVFQKVMMEEYEKAYMYYKMVYDEQLKEKLKDGKAKSLDQLIGIFKICSQNVWKQFGMLNIEPKFRDFYEQKLEKHINQQEEVILQTNRKKTTLELDRCLKMPQNMNSPTDLEQFLVDLWNQRPQLDHDRTRVIAKYLPQLSNKLQSLVEQKNPQRAQFYETLKSKWSQLRDTNSRKFESMKKEINRLQQQQANLSNEIEKLHTQLQDIKNHGYATTLEKIYENQNNQIEKMKREDQSQVVDKANIIQDLKQQIEQIQNLNEQLLQEINCLQLTTKKDKIKSHSQSKIAKPVGPAPSSRKLAQVRSVSKNRRF